MIKYIFIQDQVKENTGFKPVIKAIEENRLIIQYFPRENVYNISKALEISPQMLGVIKNTIEKLYPGITEVVQ